MFSNIEYTDMLLVYGECRLNSREACRVYSERFPQRRQPNKKTFVAVCQRLRDTGRVQPHNTNRGPRRDLREGVEEELLDAVEEAPGVSTRHLSRQFGVSHTTVHRVLQDNLLHPYHIQRVQDLLPRDFLVRSVFSQWIVDTSLVNDNFISNILATDECCFTRGGILNIHNTHSWAQENPHDIHQGNFQQRFSLNLWAGIFGDHLIGPVELPRIITGAVYLDFLQNTLPDLLDDVPLRQRANMWFLHDGAPPHIQRDVTNYLRDTFQIRWIGRNAPVPRKWPPRSPDLNPMDFYFWGHMKTLVYNGVDINDEDELRHRVFQAAETIRAMPNTLERVRNNWLRRLQACVDSDGGHFEHLL